MRQLFYINIREGKGGAIPVSSIMEAEVLNETGMDIYWVVNEFEPRHTRRIDNLKQITTIAFELDHLDKFNKEIIPTPSMIVESKNGLHVYYELKNPIDCSQNPRLWAEWYRNFIAERIEDRLGSDPQAKDAARLLRVPMMRYWKDGKGDFVIKIKTESGLKYSVEDLEIAFPINKKKMFELPKEIKAKDANGFWEKANTLPAKECLEKLSGSSAVHGEIFSFKKQKNILRIICNGKESNAWIDSNGLIGSTDGAGPSIANWIYWYQRDWKKVAEILKKEFNL